jgi:hypothetical protein
LRFKLTFELFIGFKLHTIHMSKIVPLMLPVGVSLKSAKKRRQGGGADNRVSPATPNDLECAT